MKTFKSKVDTLAEEGFLAWFWGRSGGRGRRQRRKGPFLHGFLLQNSDFAFPRRDRRATIGKVS